MVPGTNELLNFDAEVGGRPAVQVRRRAACGDQETRGRAGLEDALGVHFQAPNKRLEKVRHHVG